MGSVRESAVVPMTEPTPTPWAFEIVSGNPNTITVFEIFGPPQTARYPRGPVLVGIGYGTREQEGQSNAELIVTAVNSHAALKAENIRLREVIRKFAKMFDEGELLPEDRELVLKALDALAAEAE